MNKTVTYERFVQILAAELMAELDWIKPDSLLVEELGLQSIDVVQVVEQVEDELGFRLEGLDVSAVETVEEFYWELTAGGDNGGDSVVAGMASEAAAHTGLPHEVVMRRFMPNDIHADVETLVGMLTRRAAVTPDREAFNFQGRGTSYRELSRQVAHMAGALQLHGVGQGDRVVLVIPNSSEFFSVFYGVQHLRATAAPVFHVPQPERIARIARHCGAKAIVTLRPLARPLKKRLVKALGDTDPLLLDVPTLVSELVPAGPPLPSPEADDLAMLQYTSGTTGNSKGVMLTHRALMANLRQAIPKSRFTANDVFVSWLPIYHDLGLITMTMCPFYVGAKLCLLPVALNPNAWFNTIQEQGGTVTGAPDFALRYALRMGGNLDRYDLSSLRVMLVAAEPVRARTVARFEKELGIPGVVRPAYGLAEASVAVTFFDLDRPVIEVDAHGRVAVGDPIAGMELDIRDPEGASLAPGQEGEICLRSPSQTLGYFRNETATSALFHKDRFVRTGDIGYLTPEGMLYVVDREKNIIIVGGRNLSPMELEQAADSVPGVRMCMAVGVDSGGDAGEQVQMVVETLEKELDPRQRTQLARAVRHAVQEQLGVRAERVHLVPARTIPRTYNGKLQYKVMRDRLMAGSPLA